jgi:hypothetical protein
VKLTELAHFIVEEGYPIPLDMMSSMASEGIVIDEFISHIEGGWTIDTLIDQFEMYGE